MHPFHLRSSSLPSRYNHVLSSSIWPSLGYFVECMQLHPTTMHSNYQMTLAKSIYLPCASVSSSTRIHQSGDLHFKVDARETSGVEKYFQLECNPESAEMQASNGKVWLDGYHQSAESPIQQKETSRKRRKKHGNKGRVPWNKGIKHTPETRALIKQRTLEALRDPQVRKKMSEQQRTHSEENKEKIRFSLRRIWDKRLKWKRLREKFFLSWAESIAEAARKGGSDQRELEWDSYDKIKEEIVLLRSRHTKKARLVKARRETEAKEKANPKPNEEAKSGARRTALHQRLTKISKNKIASCLVPGQRESLMSSTTAWERLEMELTRREKVQNQISLADQIQAAKNRRTESLAREAHGAPSKAQLLNGVSLESAQICNYVQSERI